MTATAKLNAALIELQRTFLQSSHNAKKPLVNKRMPGPGI